VGEGRCLQHDIAAVARGVRDERHDECQRSMISESHCLLIDPPIPIDLARWSSVARGGGGARVSVGVENARGLFL
jgi:hypothetical protein